MNPTILITTNITLNAAQTAFLVSEIEGWLGIQADDDYFETLGTADADELEDLAEMLLLLAQTKRQSEGTFSIHWSAAESLYCYVDTEADHPDLIEGKEITLEELRDYAAKLQAIVYPVEEVLAQMREITAHVDLEAPIVGAVVI